MAKTLGDYLRSIGQEEYSYVDETDTIQVITKDEMLCRWVVKMALGYEDKSINADGGVSCRTYPPDKKMLMFIFERREGKVVIPQEEKSIVALEKVSELLKAQVNAEAEDIVGDSDDSSS